MPICLAESSLPYPISHSIKAPISDPKNFPEFII